MAQSYDVIVVGARCAGSPTAMLLARLGHRVLVVDRATFPSDTMSTHMIHVPGVAALARWGLADRLAATGCPPLTQYAFDFGPFTLVGTPRPVEGSDRAYAPRADQQALATQVRELIRAHGGTPAERGDPEHMTGRRSPRASEPSPDRAPPPSPTTDQLSLL